MFDPFGMYEGAFVMTDRGTGTIWAHLTGEGLAGPLLGRTLDQVPVVTTTARAWMDAHPDSSAPDRAVMAPPMDLSPKLGATTLETISRLDERLEAHTLVLGVMAGGRVRAYAMHEGLRLHQDTLGDVPIALIASDGGYPLAYDRRLAENVLELRVEAGHVVDQFGTSWSGEGLALIGRDRSTRLTFVPSHLSDWFAWSAYHPDTDIRFPT